MVLLGPPSPPQHRESVAWSKRRSDFLSALQAIPNDEKKAYLEVLERSPNLLQSETPIDRFIVCEAYDSELAATRFVSYWQHRRKLFGERAFRPLRLKHGGALSEDDVSVLSAGLASVMPCDNKGRCVLAMESTYAPPAVSDVGYCRQRVLFYLLHLVSQNSSAQEEGIVGLYIFNDPVIDDRSIAFGLEVLGDHLPIRLHHIHVVCVPQCPHLGNFFERVLPVVVRTAGEFHGSGKRYTVQIGNSPAVARSKLQKLGLLPHGLPPITGGTCDALRQLDKWIESQTVKENAKPEASAAAAAATTPAPTPPFPNRDDTTGKSLSKAERDSKNGIRHSRKKRMKQRANQESLEVHVRHLQANNELFRTENDSLEGLLGQAQHFLQTGAFPTTEQQGDSEQHVVVSSVAASAANASATSRSVGVAAGHASSGGDDDTRTAIATRRNVSADHPHHDATTSSLGAATTGAGHGAGIANSLQQHQFLTALTSDSVAAYASSAANDPNILNNRRALLGRGSCPPELLLSGNLPLVPQHPAAATPSRSHQVALTQAQQHEYDRLLLQLNRSSIIMPPLPHDQAQQLLIEPAYQLNTPHILQQPQRPLRLHHHPFMLHQQQLTTAAGRPTLSTASTTSTFLSLPQQPPPTTTFSSTASSATAGAASSIGNLGRRGSGTALTSLQPGAQAVPQLAPAATDSAILDAAIMALAPGTYQLVQHQPAPVLPTMQQLLVRQQQEQQTLETLLQQQGRERGQQQQQPRQLWLPAPTTAGAGARLAATTAAAAPASSSDHPMSLSSLTQELLRSHAPSEERLASVLQSSRGLIMQHQAVPAAASTASGEPPFSLPPQQERKRAPLSQGDTIDDHGGGRGGAPTAQRQPRPESVPSSRVDELLEDEQNRKRRKTH